MLIDTNRVVTNHRGDKKFHPTGEIRAVKDAQEWFTNIVDYECGRNDAVHNPVDPNEFVVILKPIVTTYPLPDFLDGEWQCMGEHPAPFRVIPDLVPESAHGSVMKHSGSYRTLYRDGKSYPIGDKFEVERKLKCWVRV